VTLRLVCAAYRTDLGSRDKYRMRALECLLAADGMTTPERKVSMREIAQRWLALAIHLERMEVQNLVREGMLPEGSAD
jgi:hypothetical protein